MKFNAMDINRKLRLTTTDNPTEINRYTGN
jgi:hypothetical protein